MTKFALVEHTNPNVLQRIRWYEDGGDRWLDHRCGDSLSKNDTQVLDVAEADDFKQLDHKRALLLEDSDAGWLSRSGRFYPCRYCDHDALAELVLGKRVTQLEREGWVRVPGAGASLVCDLEPTWSQIRWATEHDHMFESFNGRCDSDLDQAA